MTSPVRAAVLLAVVGALSACSFEPTSFTGTRYQCGSDGTCPSGFSCSAGVCLSALEGPDAGGPDAGPPRPDAPPGLDSWVVDTAAEMAAAAGPSTAAIAARGALEPYAYLTGALLERGSDTGTFTDAAATTWDEVRAMPSSGRVAVARGSDIPWGNAAPPGLAFTSGDAFTVGFEGEVFLAQGTWTFEGAFDDRGFLEIADADGTFRRVVNTVRFDTAVEGTYTAAATGWYPIRFATCEDGGGAGARVRFRGPGVSSLVAIPRHRLRARTDELVGLVQTVWRDQRGKGDNATRIDASEIGNIDWRSDGPSDLGLTDYNFFSVRWSGQARIDVAGLYTFRYQSDDGQRLWIDGVKVLDRWDETAHNQTTTPIDLAVGWHDIVIDVSESTTDARALLTVDAGPDLVGQALPLDRLRPVEGRGERFETGKFTTDLAIPDGGSITTPTISVVAPAGATATAVDIRAEFNHPFWRDLRLELLAPDGSLVLPRVFDNTDGSGQRAVHQTVALTGSLPAGGDWKLKVIDEATQDVGTFLDFQLTVHHARGEPPIATEAAFESTLHDLGAPTAFESIRWSANTPAGTSVVLRLRTCATPSACESAAWSPPLDDPEGATAPFAPQRYVQWRAELTSNGDATPSLESVQIDTRVTN